MGHVSVCDVRCIVEVYGVLCLDVLGETLTYTVHNRGMLVRQQGQVLRGMWRAAHLFDQVDQ